MAIRAWLAGPARRKNAGRARVVSSWARAGPTCNPHGLARGPRRPARKPP